MIPVAAGWQTYTDSSLGLSLSYPPDWQTSAYPGQPGVLLSPPGADGRVPCACITVLFLESTAYPSAAPSGATPVTIGGIAGRQQEPSRMTAPVAATHIELPYRDGVLDISATTGPDLDLEPELREVLKTVRLQP